MRRIELMALASILTIGACDKSTATPDDAAAAKPAATEGVPADAETTPDPAAEEAAKKKAREERIQKAIAGLEAEVAKEKERFTPELEAAITALVSKKFKKANKAVAAVLASAHRTDENKARDEFRHPAETLKFFGLERDSVVVECGPGGGWYTEILAPIVSAKGKLVVPGHDPNGPDTEVSTYFGKSLALMLGMSEALYGKVEVVQQADTESVTLGAEGSADLVIATREMHNWYRGEKMDTWLSAVHAVLKPGATFGVVQHRAPQGTKPEDTAGNGRLDETWVIETVKAAGFELVDASDINANDKDTRDFRVWLLPPVNAGKDDAEKAKYAPLGESDRMTLKFKKI